MSIFKTLRLGARVLALGLAATLVAPAASAQSTYVEYIGGGYLTNAYNCDEAGWPSNIEMFRARYVPSLSGRTSTVTLDLAVGGTMVYNMRGDMDENGNWMRGNGYSVWGALYRARPAPTILVLQRMDAATGNAVIPRTPQLRMSLRIRNFNGRRGCIVDAHMMLRNPSATGFAY